MYPMEPQQSLIKRTRGLLCLNYITNQVVIAEGETHLEELPARN